LFFFCCAMDWDYHQMLVLLSACLSEAKARVTNTRWREKSKLGKCLLAMFVRLEKRRKQ
jgi:hypothetical protein